MLKKKSFKKVIISILALTMVLGTVAFAADSIYTKNLTATYGKVKIKHEGSDVTSQVEKKYGTPAFISGGRTYVPVRAIGDLMGVDIDYDDANHTILITDPKLTEHKNQINDKNKEIEDLKAKITKLEKEDKKEDVAAKDLKSLQTSLNKEYSEYERVEFDIVLKESNNKITIDINTNLANTRDEQNWIRMKYTDKKYLIEDIVGQTEKEFKNASITGSIYDSFSRRNLYTFRVNTNGNVSITSNDNYGSNNDSYGGYVERTVRSEFDAKKIYDARLSKLDYYSRSAYFEIDFSSKYEDVWDDLTEKEIVSMLDYISREVERDYDYDYDYNYDYIDYIDAKIFMGNKELGKYTRDMRDNSGTFR